MKKYRSPIDIVTEILRIVAPAGECRTRIMYGAYLSHTQTEQYITLLLRKGLIAQTPSPPGLHRRFYALTARGRRVLDELEDIDRTFWIDA